MIVDLVKQNGWLRGIELGLGMGMLHRRLLVECPGLSMIGVDLGGHPDRKLMQLAISETFPTRCRLLHCSTQTAAALVDDGWADFIFIDAGHGYAAVKDDIKRWRSKVKPGGWFGGHDYHPAHPGVIRAVDEEFGPAVSILAHSVWVAA